MRLPKSNRTESTIVLHNRRTLLFIKMAAVAAPDYQQLSSDLEKQELEVSIRLSLWLKRQLKISERRNSLVCDASGGENLFLRSRL